MIWKGIFLRYTLGFFASSLAFSWLTILLAKLLVTIHFMPASVYTFWVWAGGPTMVFAAGLSVRSTIKKKDPEEWGVPVSRFFTFTLCLATIAPFLAVHFPNAEVGFERWMSHVDSTIRDIFDPRPQQINIKDAYTEQWFDRDGQPLIWYAQNPNGTERYFRGSGPDPVTGVELKPVTQSIVEEEKRREDEVNKELQRQRGQQAQSDAAAAKAAKDQKERIATAKKADAVAEQHRQYAIDAENALAAGNYDRALEDCPDATQDVQDDSCASVHRKAAQMKAAVLVGQSNEEFQEDETDNAIRDAVQALKLDPDNEAGKKILRLAQTLKRADASHNQ
jgi:hypothetical protein